MSLRYGWVTLLALAVCVVPAHAEDVTLALKLARQTDPLQAKATVVMDNLAQGVRGVSADLGRDERLGNDRLVVVSLEAISGLYKSCENKA